MNRRGFLAALLGGAVLDPERLLWRPGAKLISIPKVSAYDLYDGGWVIIEGCLVTLHSQIDLMWATTNGYGFAGRRLKIGDTIRLRDAFMREVKDFAASNPPLPASPRRLRR